MRHYRVIAVGLLAMFAGAASASAAADDSLEQRMVVLYDELCLRAFPDDAAVDAYMAARGARALTPDEVRITFKDDPGRGWMLQDGDTGIQVMLELPPYHACSVRWMISDGIAYLPDYLTVMEAYKASRPGFEPQPQMKATVNELDVSTADFQRRPLPDGGAETLLVIEQRVADAARRAAGETRVSLRFVHQIVSPDAP